MTESVDGSGNMLFSNGFSGLIITLCVPLKYVCVSVAVCVCVCVCAVCVCVSVFLEFVCAV